MRKDLDIFIRATTVAALAAGSACARIAPVQPESTATRVRNTQTVPPPTPTSTTIAETITPQIPEWQRPLNERFSLGSLNLAEMNFNVAIPSDLLEQMLFTDTKIRVYPAKNPLEVVTDYIPYDGDKGVGTEFANSAEEDGGKTPMIFLTDRPNILLFVVHSESLKAPGEPTRIIGSYLTKHPEDEDGILGKNLIIQPEGKEDINAPIVFVKTVTRAEYEDDESEKRFWSKIEEWDNIVFFDTGTAGIPDSIRFNQTPGVYYVIFATCMPQGGNPININPFDPQRYNFNTAERAFVVVEIDFNIQNK